MRLLVIISMWLYGGTAMFKVVDGARDGWRCGALRPAELEDKSVETREHAARDLVFCQGRQAVRVEMAQHLRNSIGMGNSTAAALLLLGEAGNRESQAFLKERQMNPTRDVRWAPDSQPVSESVVAMVARLSKAANEVKPQVMALASNPGIAEAEFLLDALSYIDDHEVMIQVAKLLEDTRPLPNKPNVRLCDYAAQAFVKRLKLRPSFYARDLAVYDQQQLDEIRRLTARKLR